MSPAPKGKNPGPGLVTSPSFRRQDSMHVRREKNSQNTLQYKATRLIPLPPEKVLGF
jgi:hypothetical protein